MFDIYEFLKIHNIDYERFDHPAVFTCEEADKVRELFVKMGGVPTKNLFLRDKDGKRHFLVVVGHEKNVDLKMLRILLNVSKLSFGSPENLMRYLGVTPGAVTLLGLVHDGDRDGVRHVEIIFDESLWGKPLQCHPLVNTATLAISHAGILKFLRATGHEYKVLEVPRKNFRNL